MFFVRCNIMRREYTRAPKSSSFPMDLGCRISSQDRDQLLRRVSHPTHCRNESPPLWRAFYACKLFPLPGFTG